MADPRPDLVETVAGSPVTFAPLANDSPEGLVLLAFQQPSFGTLAFDPGARTFTYTPAAGFVGEDSFEYTVRAPDGSVGRATVTIRVRRPNGPPRATDDVAEVAPGGIVDIPVLANDSDPDGDPLALIGVSAPTAGSVAVLPDQRVRYAPRSGFTGEDSFTYTIGDGRGGTATATVRVAVRPANRPPAAHPDRVATTSGEPVTIDLLANDSDPDGDPLVLLNLSLPEHGDLALLAGGRVTYTPRPGFEGTDRFTYTVGDGRGGTATGEVEILVQRPNAAPRAVDDRVTTETGRSVTFAPLANDSDPDGDPLVLAALSVPAHGRLAVSADGRVTYTPDPGFVGEDAFSYTVRDPRGATASATVRVEVAPPSAPTTYLNGYRYRRRLVVPKSSILGTAPLSRFPLLVREEGDWLKNKSAGGRIESPQGFDLRFELADGTKLAHDIELYDPSGGRLLAWVRLPELRPQEDLVFFLYYGKDGLSESEADPAATWRDYLAVWHLPDLRDRTGRGRDLGGSGVAAAEGPVGPAGSFDGATSELLLADPSFLDGHRALTVQLWLRSGRLDSEQGLLMCGPRTGADHDAAFVLRHADIGPFAAQRRVFAVQMALADGRLIHESGPGRADDRPHALALVFERGEGATLVIDGVADTPSYTAGATLLGPTRIGRGPLRIGTGPRLGAAGTWQGLIDQVRIRASALPAAWLAMEYANQSAPRAFYGLGGEDAFGDAGSAPVAAPVVARTVRGTAVTVDPLASALLVEGGSASLVAVGTPSNGTAAIEAGKIRYTPASGFVGTDRFTFTISANGKSSTGTATVVVAAAASETSPQADRPFADRFFGNPFHVDALSPRTPVLHGPVAKRFLADRSGSLVGVRWPCRVLSGDGGELVLQVETDQQGKPSGLVIGTTAINGDAGALATQGPYPFWRFEQPVPIEAGRAYHLVWHQLAGSGGAAILFHRADVPLASGQNLRGGPYEGDAGTVHQRVSGSWQPGDEHGGFLELHWADGAVTGNPILEGKPGLKKSFGGSTLIRQRFTVTDYTRKVDGLWLRVWWESGTPADLLVRLETLEGTLLEQLAIPRSALPQTRNVAGDPSSPPAFWVYRRFAQSHILERGRSYVLRLSTASGSYVAQAVRRAENASRDQWPQAWAEISTNGGTSWRGWDDAGDPSGVARTDCHLPVAFTVAGSLERLGVDGLIGSHNFPITDFRRLSEDAGVGDGTVEARGTTNGQTAWAHFGFPTPARPPVGRQLFRIRARCSVAGGAIKVELFENGAFRRDLGTQPLGTSFSTLSFAWDAALLSDRSGAGVELRLWLVDNLASGYYAIDAIDWLADPAGAGSSHTAATQQRLRPDEIVAWINWGGWSLDLVREDAGIGDNQGANRAATVGDWGGVRLGFENPQGPLVGTQVFRVRARCSVSGGAVRVRLFEGGTLVRDLGTRALSGTGFQTLSWEWQASEVSNPQNVQAEVTLKSDLSSGFYTLDAVDWLANVGGQQANQRPWPAGWGPRPPLGSHLGLGLVVNNPWNGGIPGQFRDWLNGREPNIAAALFAAPATWDDVAGGAGTSDTTWAGQLTDNDRWLRHEWWPRDRPVVIYLVGAPYSHRNYNPSTGQWRSPSIWAEIKTGTYDAYYRRLWRRLATRCGQQNRDPNTLVIRWCGENTANWKPDSIGPDKQSFIDGFRRTIDLMRQEVGNVLGAGKTFMVEFGPTMHLHFGQGPTVERLWNVYPGDDWVDVIGMGIHDYKGMTVQQDWDAMLVKNNYLGQWVEGMRDWFDFGASRNKWIGTSEICSNVNTYPPTNPIHPRTQNMHVMWTNGFEPLRRRYDGRFLYFCYMWVSGDRNRTDALVTQLWQPDGWGEPFRQLYKL
ncbi:MAG: Ig-like domain-containing protein [Geminicoccaceae bacterium]|nr:Ig-like domain-containing protein [Geminicoccaceae bacterium]